MQPSGSAVSAPWWVMLGEFIGLAPILWFFITAMFNLPLWPQRARIAESEITPPPLRMRRGNDSHVQQKISKFQGRSR